MKEQNVNIWTPGTEGIFEGVPAEIYHKAPGVSNSMLKHMDPPSNLPAYLRQSFEETSAMILGTLVHQRVLEPDVPMPRIAVKPEGMTFASTIGKAWRDEATKAGRLIITSKDWEVLGNCVKAISEHRTCKTFFEEGESEVSAFVRHQPTGLLRKMRFDFVACGDYLVDVKTTVKGGAAPNEFAKTLYDMRYYVQAAYYLDGWNALMGATDEKKAFAFIVVEKGDPYNIAIRRVRVGSKTYQLGKARYEADLEVFDRCNRENEWPGYSMDPVDVELPGWAVRREEEG